MGECKTWTPDWTHGLDYGLELGLELGLEFGLELNFGHAIKMHSDLFRFREYSVGDLHHPPP
jgi:hypothetical protein